MPRNAAPIVKEESPEMRSAEQHDLLPHRSAETLDAGQRACGVGECWQALLGIAS